MVYHPNGQTYCEHWAACGQTSEQCWYRLWQLYEPDRGPWPYDSTANWECRQ